MLDAPRREIGKSRTNSTLTATDVAQPIPWECQAVAISLEHAVYTESACAYTLASVYEVYGVLTYVCTTPSPVSPRRSACQCHSQCRRCALHLVLRGHATPEPLPFWNMACQCSWVRVCAQGSYARQVGTCPLNVM